MNAGVKLHDLAKFNLRVSVQWNLEQIMYTVYAVILPKYLDIKELGLHVRQCTCYFCCKKRKRTSALTLYFLFTILPYLPRASEVTVNLFRAFIQIK